MTVRRATITSKGQITIPVEVRRSLKLEPGDTVRFEVLEGRATMVPELPEDPFAVWIGAMRDGEGEELEAILTRQREDRGW